MTLGHRENSYLGNAARVTSADLSEGSVHNGRSWRNPYWKVHIVANRKRTIVKPGSPRQAKSICADASHQRVPLQVTESVPGLPRQGRFIPLQWRYLGRSRIGRSHPRSGYFGDSRLAGAMRDGCTSLAPSDAFGSAFIILHRMKDLRQRVRIRRNRGMSTSACMKPFSRCADLVRATDHPAKHGRTRGHESERREDGWTT